MQKLADILPYDGRVLLTRVAKMAYCAGVLTRNQFIREWSRCVTIDESCVMGVPSIDWFSDQTCIQFSQIKDLEGDGYPTDMQSHFNVFAFENLEVLRMVGLPGSSVDGFLRLFHPDPGAGVPCRSLREFECAYLGSKGPLTRSFVNLVRERERAGHWLRLVNLCVALESGRNFVELREYVGKVQVKEWSWGCRSVVVSVPLRRSMDCIPS